MPWLIFQLMAGYLAIGALVSVAFHGLSLTLSNQQADGRHPLCLFEKSVGEMFHDAYRITPEQARPLLALRMAAAWCLVWPLIALVLVFYLLHPCSLEEPPDNDQDPSTTPKEKNP